MTCFEQEVCTTLPIVLCDSRIINLSIAVSYTSGYVSCCKFDLTGSRDKGNGYTCRTLTIKFDLTGSRDKGTGYTCRTLSG